MVTDAWNGYHSVPLRKSDWHLTTFITPFGYWHYTRAPEGFLSSGDGYNHCFDAVLSTFECKEHCIDDTIHHDIDLEQHWWRTIDLLTLSDELPLCWILTNFSSQREALTLQASGYLTQPLSPYQNTSVQSESFPPQIP